MLLLEEFRRLHALLKSGEATPADRKRWLELKAVVERATAEARASSAPTPVGPRKR
jgi:hypothetical protein